jgi:hypothetical protein
MHTNLPVIRELDANVWFADETTLVVAKMFDDGSDRRVPLAPHHGADHLRPALRGLLRDRVGASAQVWLAGQVPAPDELFPPLALVLGMEDNAAVRKLKTFGLWLTAGPEGAAVRGAFDCDDDAAARALEAYLAPTQHKGIKEWFAPGETGPMEREFARSLTISRQGTWVELQAKASASAIQKGN